MALTSGDVELWRRLKGQIPLRPHVLEIGEANWYGSQPAPPGCEDADLFAVAKKFYRKVLDYKDIVAIDLHGTPSAIKWDLNRPTEFIEKDYRGNLYYDIIINTGTAEHIFNQHQLFTTIHDYCNVGGLMVHCAPWQGWHNHGFYCYQPMFFHDLARANGYAILAGFAYHFATGHVYDGWESDLKTADDVQLYVALRKTTDAEFRMPMQGSMGL